jgi:hypothetical protein
MTSRQRSIRRELDERHSKKIKTREEYWKKILRKKSNQKP